jgi:hypothetical protein
MFKRFLPILFVVLAARPVAAEVLRVELSSRKDILNSKSFGNAGPFEEISGKVFFAADPKNTSNLIITDIDKAPKNSSGKVEFAADFYLIKPKDASRGNGSVLLEVPNRGNKRTLAFFDFAGGTAEPRDPQTDAQVGDGFLLEQGFTLLWVGWQFDVPVQEGLLRAYLPIAHELTGRPIEGLVRSDFTVAEKTTEMSLADRDHQAYPVSNPKDLANVMTVRDTVEGMRRRVPRDQWDFTPDGKSVRMPGGFEINKIYEVVYKAKDPTVVGLGLAAIRDTISKMKYGEWTELGLSQGGIKRAIGFGISQSGRFLRTYLYYGFNEDEGHRKVFDGVMTRVAGSGRGAFNNRFAQPSRDANPFRNFFYPVDIFPFTDTVQTDPLNGKKDGLLTHHMKPEFMPKIMYTNSSHEYWGRAASLFTTTIDGKEDVQLLPEVRVYMYAGGNHTISAFPPTRSIGQQLNDPLEYRWAARKLIASLNQWITDGTEPPASVYPRIENSTLIAPDKLQIPKMPNVGTAGMPHKAYRADYGLEFLTKGIVSIEPPKIGPAYPIFVPQVDPEGNDIPGIRLPEIAVPLATYLGWNRFNEKSGPTSELATQVGSFIPFARTRAERQRNGDSRSSIEERYKNKEDYLVRITNTADDLAAQGYILKQDIPRIVQQAGARWDWIMSQP